MSSPSLSFVAGIVVCYLLARVVDKRGQGGIFLPVGVLCILHGEQAIVPGLFAILAIGGLLTMLDATREK